MLILDELAIAQFAMAIRHFSSVKVRTLCSHIPNLVAIAMDEFRAEFDR